MRIPSTIIFSDTELVDLFQKTTGIPLCTWGRSQCPKGSIKVEYDDCAYYKEQNHFLPVTLSEENFEKWDDKTNNSYRQTEEDALSDLKKLTNKDTITYDVCLGFLVAYGYIPKVNLYIITDTPLSY